ncbi:MAG: T9SS type B sorting domain-containing protein, partial [Chlorobi bacterium]|nr:T9SS type B sorting domain-containing protein [Chlorobiota bacterium]
GTSPYAYLWSTNTGSGLTPTAKDQSGLTAARYYVDITDDNSCLKQDSFDVTEPLPITFGGSTVIDIVTPPGGNGEIDLVVSGGTPVYVFAWTGPNSYTSAEDSLFNLADAGTYNLHLDVNSCVKDSSFLVSSNTAFLAFISNKQDVSCRGSSDGSATVSTTGGTGPYSFAWKDALNNPVGTNDSVLSNVPAGTYYVTVTDNSDSRTADASTVISEPTQDLVITLNNRQHISCNGAADGIIDIGVSGGWGSYSYSWTGPGGFTATTEDITGLEAGFYSLTVTDGGGCIATLLNIEIQEPSVLSASIAKNQGILCNGELSGELEANPVGGTTPYAYAWNDPGGQTTKRATFLAAGNYTVTVTDNSGCTTQASELLTEPPAIDVSAVVQDVSCPGQSDGLIALTVTGGTPQFSYLWTPNNEITKDISGLAGGDYSITVTDNNNCTWDSTFTVTEPAPMVIDSVSVTDISGCPGSNNGELVIHVTGGTMPYEYSVDGGTTFLADSTFSNLVAGNYDIFIRDAGSCTLAGNTITLNDPPGVTIDQVNAANLTCNGSADGTIIINASGGATPYTYSINGGSSYQADSLFSSLAAGNYDIAVQDNNGCVTLGNTITLTEPDAIVLSSTDITNTCAGLNQGAITVTVTGGTGTLSYILFLQQAALDSNNVGTFSNLDLGTYTVQVDDENSCGPVTSNAIEVAQADNCGIKIFDAFTPNGDNINDLWEIQGIQAYPNCTVQVFNTWGVMVFSSRGYPEPWDGTFNGNPLPAGTYYYVINLGPGEETFSGTVNIVK